MILGIGVDSIEISRVVKAMEKEHFVHRIFTEKERECRCRNPEKGGRGEIIVGFAADHHLVCIEQTAADDILHACTYIAGKANDADSCAGGFSRHDVDGHQAAEETDQYADGRPE